MPEPNGTSQRREGAGPDKAPPPPGPVGPRAVPEPSAASRGLPVPKPVRPRRSREPDRPPSTTLTRTTRPGLTQAAKLGTPQDTSEAGFTTHLHRDQDRVNIRERVDVAYRFVAQGRPELSQRVFHGKLVDVSLGGAQLEGVLPEGVTSEELLSEEVMLKAEMALPFVEGPLAVDSNVAWIKPAECGGVFFGLDFIDMTEERLKVVRAFLIGLQSPTRTKFRRGR